MDAFRILALANAATDTCRIWRAAEMATKLFLLSPAHAAGRMRLSVSRLRQLEALGVLTAIRDSAGRRLYHAADIDECIKRREEQRRERAERASTIEPLSAA